MEANNLKKYIVFLVVIALCAFAPVANAQTAQPSIGVNRVTDKLPKQIQETAIVVILDSSGKPVASRPIFDVNLPVCELYKELGMWMDYRLANVVTDVLEVTFFPEEGAFASRDKKATNALFDKLKRIDVGGVGKDYKSKQNLYGGRLESLKQARVGYNSLSIRSITHHANSTEVLMANSTDWRRNFLNSDLSVIVVDGVDDQGQLLLMAKANGYRFNDPKVDFKLANALAALQQGQQQGSTSIVDSQQGQDQTDRDREVETKRQTISYQVNFRLDGKDCNETAKLKVDQRVEVGSNLEVKVEIWDVRAEKLLSEATVPAEDYRRFRFRNSGSYRIEVRSADGKRLINEIAVEVK